jgi:hypothetical protein
MQTETVNTVHRGNKSEGGIVYRTTCQNSGCGHSFDLRITPENAGLLSGTLACPRCRRHGGMLKPQGRIAHKLFAANLVYRMTGVAPKPDEDYAYTEATEIRY